MSQTHGSHRSLRQSHLKGETEQRSTELDVFCVWHAMTNVTGHESRMSISYHQGQRQFSVYVFFQFFFQISLLRSPSRRSFLRKWRWHVGNISHFSPRKVCVPWHNKAEKCKIKRKIQQRTLPLKTSLTCPQNQQSSSLNRSRAKCYLYKIYLLLYLKKKKGN